MICRSRYAWWTYSSYYTLRLHSFKKNFFIMQPELIVTDHVFSKWWKTEKVFYHINARTIWSWSVVLNHNLCRWNPWWDEPGVVLPVDQRTTGWCHTDPFYWDATHTHTHKPSWSSKREQCLLCFSLWILPANCVKYMFSFCFDILEIKWIFTY